MENGCYVIYRDTLTEYDYANPDLLVELRDRLLSIVKDVYAESE